jgi:hypothetical protein
LLIKKARHVNENEKVDFFGREKWKRWLTIWENNL